MIPHSGKGSHDSLHGIARNCAETALGGPDSHPRGQGRVPKSWEFVVPEVVQLAMECKHRYID